MSNEPSKRCLVQQSGFWFVDIPRTSSSSIRSELGARFGKAHGKKNVIEKEYSTPQIFPDHIPAKRMRSVLGRSIWDEIFTFTFVRNPFDRIYSMYNYRRKVAPRLKYSFRDYVLALRTADPDTPFFKYQGFRYGASDYLLGDDGEIIVDFVGKYENRVNDLNAVASLLKLNDFGKNFIQKASPQNRHYSEFYDSEMKEIIYELYAKDMALFDYEFEQKT